MRPLMTYGSRRAKSSAMLGDGTRNTSSPPSGGSPSAPARTISPRACDSRINRRCSSRYGVRRLMKSATASYCNTQYFNALCPLPFALFPALPALVGPDLLRQRRHPGWRAGEDAVGLLRVMQHVGENHVGAVQVETAAGQVLQAQDAVAVDLGVLQPALVVRGAAGVGAKQVDRRVHPDLAQRLRHRRVLRTLQPLLQLVDVDPRRLDLAEQDEVVALAVVGVGEDHAVRERL